MRMRVPMVAEGNDLYPSVVTIAITNLWFSEVGVLSLITSNITVWSNPPKSFFSASDLLATFLPLYYLEDLEWHTRGGSNLVHLLL